jgi:hypothetical protein
MYYSEFQQNTMQEELYQIDPDDHLSYMKATQDSWSCPFYKKKIAELMRRICDDSTIIYIPSNGDITVVKIKTSSYYYIWDQKKSKFITQKNRNLYKYNNNKDPDDYNHYSMNLDGSQSDDQDDYDEETLELNKIKNAQESIQNCPKYNKSLGVLLESLANESTTVGSLYNGIVMAIKTKSIMITYKWDSEIKDFVSHKNKYNRTNKK